VLANEGKVAQASAVLCSLLESAPPGFAAGTIPIEPFLNQTLGTQEFAEVLQRLADRAR